MALDGNEKRIQALYSELSLEDQTCAPQFGHLWSRAQAIRATEPGRLGRPFAIVISVLVTAIACSIVWAWYALTPAPPLTIVNHLPPGTIVEAPARPTPVPVHQPEKMQPRRQRNLARRKADRRLSTEAALLSAWQSPTQAFMQLPTGLTLSSLPQLNQSVKELESFLPRNDEIMKESNR
jgi:hypothetical protein